ncbi:hypothetical protein PanWU01x14_214450 [Parasponia andersonii]|uniref:Transmembrane protein n=1 Tax=Parasponia andersonii TaxID=3476 RepID=A0A2P5BSK3_PARAD|nr:hypothetical protein PanWU01x14_214450 [Parasponia andersonii]
MRKPGPNNTTRYITKLGFLIYVIGFASSHNTTGLGSSRASYTACVFLGIFLLLSPNQNRSMVKQNSVM